MQRELVLQPRFVPEHDGNVATVLLPAESLHVDPLERYARDHRDAVIALLPVERDVLIAEPLEALERKSLVRALRLLQAEYVRPHRLDELGDEIDAQADRIDVPGRDREGHHADLMRRGTFVTVMTGLIPAVHVFLKSQKCGCPEQFYH